MHKHFVETHFGETFPSVTVYTHAKFILDTLEALQSFGAFQERQFDKAHHISPDPPTKSTASRHPLLFTHSTCFGQSQAALLLAKRPITSGEVLGPCRVVLVVAAPSPMHQGTPRPHRGLRVQPGYHGRRVEQHVRLPSLHHAVQGQPVVTVKPQCESESGNQP